MMRPSVWPEGIAERGVPGEPDNALACRLDRALTSRMTLAVPATGGLACAQRIG